MDKTEAESLQWSGVLAKTLDHSRSTGLLSDPGRRWSVRDTGAYSGPREPTYVRVLARRSHRRYTKWTYSVLERRSLRDPSGPAEAASCAVVCGRGYASRPVVYPRMTATTSQTNERTVHLLFTTRKKDNVTETNTHWRTYINTHNQHTHTRTRR